MSHTGHYEWVEGSWCKISDAIPTLAMDVYFNRGGVSRYDPSARCTFQSKSDKRLWLKRWGLKEGGIIRNPDKRWEGSTRNASRPSLAQRQERARQRAWMASRGGVQGLLARTTTKGA